MANQLREALGLVEENQIRSNIDRVIYSYRHVWDIFSELLQNAGDAVHEQHGPDSGLNGSVSLDVFPNQRKIVIQDNGIGLDEDEIAKILVTGKSFKRERDAGTHGFMGFGFTYVAFQTSYLRITSTHDGSKSSRTYDNLYKYIFENEDLGNSREEEQEIPPEVVDEPNGTKIECVFPNPFTNTTMEEALRELFDIATNSAALVALLRTKTLVGCLDSLFGGSQPFIFTLKVDGEEIDCPVGHLWTRDIVQEVLPNTQRAFELDSYETTIVAATETLDDLGKYTARRCDLLDLKAQTVTIGQRNPIHARLYCAATSKTHLNDYNTTHLNLNEESSFLVDNGIWLAIAGMPTGVCLDPLSHGSFLPYSCVVDISDDSIRGELDAGRKGISQYRVRQIIDFVKEYLVNRNFIRYREYVSQGRDQRAGNPLYDPKAHLRTKFEAKQPSTAQLWQNSLPPSDEQEIVALFAELCALKKIAGYSLKALSGFEVYDGLFSYSLDNTPSNHLTATNILGIRPSVFQAQGDPLQKPEVVLEFKLEMNGLYRDVASGRKDLNHIDVLVCWDCNYEGRDEISPRYGFNLQTVDAASNVYYGVSHQLSGHGGATPLYIIELSRVVELLPPPSSPVG